MELKQQILSYTPVVPAKTILFDSRSKWAKSLPVFSPKGPKSHNLCSGTYKYDLYKGAPSPPLITLVMDNNDHLLSRKLIFLYILCIHCSGYRLASSSVMGQRYTLFFTAREGREDDLRWALFDRKISPDLREPDTKQTALHLAAAKGRLGCVKLLIEAGKYLA